MPDQRAPRRRFQFRLRTLMIAVTLLAVPLGYVGWQAKIVRERHEALAKYPSWSGMPISDSNSHSPRPDAPWPLCWMGEEGIAWIDTPESTSDAVIERLKRLFPEAKITRDGRR